MDEARFAECALTVRKLVLCKRVDGNLGGGEDEVNAFERAFEQYIGGGVRKLLRSLAITNFSVHLGSSILY